MKLKKTVAMIGVSAMLAASLVGCGDKTTTSNKELDGSKTLLTVGDDKISLSEGYFLIKLQQANYQNIIAYNGSYGDDWYSKDIFGTGESFQDYFKDYYVELLTRVAIARDKMDDYDVKLTKKEESEINTVAKNFIDSNSDEALKAMLVDEKTVRDVLVGYKILEKVVAKAVEGIDSDISDKELEEAAYTRTYDYVYISFETTDEEGNATTVSASEKEEYMNQLGTIRAQTIEDGDFDAAAEAAGQTVSSHTYNPGATASEDTLYEINEVMDKLEIGKVSDVIPLDDTGAIVAYMASDNKDELKNEDVLKEAREKVLNNRKLDKFEEVLNEWKADYEVELDEDLWKKVTMEEPLAAVSTKD